MKINLKNDAQKREEPRFFRGKPVRRTWIMVMDRKKAQVFAKTGSDLELIADAHPDFDEQGLDISNHDIGRNFVPFAGGMRSGTDPREGQQRHEERHFARAMSAWLDEARETDQYDELVLVAAPRMLGELRESFPKALQKVVLREISKDLTNLPVPDIKRHLSNVVYFRD